MRNFVRLFLIMVILSFSSCAERNSDQKVTASKSTETSLSGDVLNSGSNPGTGAWVKKGTECYGIVIGTFADGRTLGKAVKCRVIAIKPDKVRMKTIESVSLLEGQVCDKMGLAYGDTWWEEEGDIFKTREEAEAYLKEKGWLSN
jgi:hypothetical protein